jgi:hypothetical protein
VYNGNCQLYSVFFRKWGYIMKELKVLFSNEIELEDKRKMKLFYCLSEKPSIMKKAACCYGIQITKRLDDIIEYEEVEGISYSKEDVVSMIKRLYQYKVTPTSLVETVDDFVTLGA